MFPSIGEGKPVIISGRFGSGKTEVALNYVVRLSEMNRGTQPILIDLDIVTPYFRSREAMAEMDCHGVEVVAPLPLAQSNSLVHLSTLQAPVSSCRRDLACCLVRSVKATAYFKICRSMRVRFRSNTWTSWRQPPPSRVS